MTTDTHTVRVKTSSGLVMYVANKDTGDLTICEASAAKMTAAEAIYAKNLAQAHVCPADRYEFEIIPDPVEEYRKEKFRQLNLEAQAEAVAERRACQRYAEENGG